MTISKPASTYMQALSSRGLKFQQPHVKHRGVSFMCRSPDDVQKRAVLAMVVKTLAGLHGNGVVHGALSPSAVVWHSRDNAMKMCDLCCAATPGELMPISPTLRYAPPEVSQHAPLLCFPLGSRHVQVEAAAAGRCYGKTAINGSLPVSVWLSDFIWRLFAGSSLQLLASYLRC